MELTGKQQELANKLLERNFLNIAKKAQNGETLTAAEVKFLQDIGDQKQKSDEEEKRYANRLEALGYLRAQGYKIGKSKFYQDCKQGLCALEADGSVRHGALLKYIKHPRAGLLRLDHLAGNDGGGAGQRDGMAGAQTELLQKRLEKLTEQVEMLRMEREERQGALISREDFELELAAQVAVLEHGLNYAVRKCIPEQAARDSVLEALQEEIAALANVDAYKVAFRNA